MRNDRTAPVPAWSNASAVRIDDRLSSLIGRVRALIPSRADDDRRNIAALAHRLNVPETDAAWIYGRSREVGFGAAMTEYERRRVAS